MKAHKEPRVVSADRLEGSVVISFEDGRCGLYSAALLYATLSQAQELHERAVEQLDVIKPTKITLLKNLPKTS